MWQKHGVVPGRIEDTGSIPPTKKEAEGQAPAGPNRQEVDPREAEEHRAEEEHRKALAEEEMEQVGQAERLEEEHDPSPEEQGQEWREQRREQVAAGLQERHAAQVRAPLQVSANGECGSVRIG